MSPKTEAALTTILLAMVTAPKTEITEAGEMWEADMEKLPGVGLPQIHALKARGILVARTGQIGEIGGHRFYSVA